MNRFVVVGAGGHAKVVISTFQAAGYEVAAIVDDDISRKGERILGIPVIGSLSVVPGAGFSSGVIAIGNNAIREKVASEVALEWRAVIHPEAFVHPSVTLGPGTVVFAGAIIQPNTVVGAHVIVNTGATIDHDCRLGHFTHIAPGVHLAGDVRVGDASFLGIGTAVIPGIRIGRRVVLGAGAVVVRNIEDNVIAYGNPARVMRTNSALI